MCPTQSGLPPRPLVALGWLVLSVIPPATYAQGDPLINAAADQINTLTSQAVPEQTIRVGIYDGLTKKFTWELDEGYADSVHDYQKEENGGPYKPDHIAKINSFNVKYEFEVRHRPPNFKLTLRTRDAAGQIVDIDATMSGSIASVSFHPYSMAEQTVMIRPGTTVLKIRPILAAQLGAFVVPHLLVAILYEPPGAGTPFATSWASFELWNHASTTMSWGFEESSGLARSIPHNDFTKVLEGLDKLAKGAGIVADVAALFDFSWKAGVKTAADVARKMIDFMDEMFAKRTELAATYGQVEGGAAGTSISIGVMEKTDTEDGSQYPGGGDRFLHLDDVLFVYLVTDRKVLLTPVVYRTHHAPSAEALKQELPGDLAAHWLGLDPLLTGGPPFDQPDRPLPFPTPVPGTIGDSSSARFECAAGLPTLECREQPEGAGLKQHEFASVRSGSISSRTRIRKATGFENLTARLGGHGGGDALHAVTLSRSLEHLAGQETVAEVWVECTPSPQFEVQLCVDTVFRTLLPLRGQPLLPPGQAMVAGSVVDERGRPLAGERVSLAVGGRSYRVVSDQEGRFAFRFASIPTGEGAVTVGRVSQAIRLTGRPVTGVSLRVPGRRVG